MNPPPADPSSGASNGNANSEPLPGRSNDPSEEGGTQGPIGAALRAAVRWWQGIPLYLRILGGAALGVVVGMIFGPAVASFGIPSKLILRLLSALAPTLILFAVMQTLIHARIPSQQGFRLVWLLILNTLVAICIGLTVANVVQPGRWSTGEATKKAQEVTADPFQEMLENVPRSILGPFGDNGRVIGVIFIAIAFGIAFRRLRESEPIPVIEQLVDTMLKALVIVLHWIIEVIPLAVFGIVASIVGETGFGQFIALGSFVLAVLLALSLQMIWYLVRIRLRSWARPFEVIRGVRDALVMAFSTASSTATMPVTYALLRTRVGLRERSASLGSLVGANFNNDGTALYEAMAALFVAQLTGMDLTLGQQLLVVLTSVVASVGAAGIPEAGLVTMTLVFKAVGLPTEYIVMLFAVDWFLDRCRTAINVMGDVNVSCLLDGQTREAAGPPNDVEAELAKLTDDAPAASK